MTPDINASYATVISFVASLIDEEYESAPTGKWTPGQQLIHLTKSVKPVAMAFGLPHAAPTLLFGRSKQGSLTYEALVANYQAALKNGAKAGKQYTPKTAPASNRTTVAKNLQQAVQTLVNRAESLTDTQLDTLRLPHPVLGKLTFREMLYFTHYHAQHHLTSIKKYLAK